MILYFVAIHISLPLILQKFNPKDFEVIYILTHIFSYLNILPMTFLCCATEHEWKYFQSMDAHG